MSHRHLTKPPTPTLTSTDEGPRRATRGPSKQTELTRPPARHNKYYFDDQQSVFLVENTFFKVHRYYLVQGSEVFRTMFSCPSSEDGQEGVDESKPIHLPGITCRQFEALLNFFYEGLGRPSLVGSPASKKKTAREVRRQDSFLDEEIREPQGLVFPGTDLPRLCDLLFISTFYDFGSVREYAIQAIEANGGLDSIEKICYANQCDISEWLVSAYKELCQREAPLEISEAEKIGLPTAILIAKAREQLLTKNGNYSMQFSSTYSQWGYGRQDVADIVNRVFFEGQAPPGGRS